MYICPEKHVCLFDFDTNRQRVNTGQIVTESYLWYHFFHHLRVSAILRPTNFEMLKLHECQYSHSGVQVHGNISACQIVCLQIVTTWKKWNSMNYILNRGEGDNLLQFSRHRRHHCHEEMYLLPSWNESLRSIPTPNSETDHKKLYHCNNAGPEGIHSWTERLAYEYRRAKIPAVSHIPWTVTKSEKKIFTLLKTRNHSPSYSWISSWCSATCFEWEIGNRSNPTKAVTGRPVSCLETHE